MLGSKFLDGFETMAEPCLISAREEVAKLMAEICDLRPARWLSLCGHSGTGKTMLARRFGRFMRARGQFYNHTRTDAQLVRRWAYWGEAELARALREGDHHLVNDLSQQWLLVLDDIGSTNDSTGFITSAIGEILNRRAGKWTFLTSNRTVEQWATKESRIASRMLRDGNQVVKMECLDYSLRKLQEVA